MNEKVDLQTYPWSHFFKAINSVWNFKIMDQNIDPTGKLPNANEEF